MKTVEDMSARRRIVLGAVFVISLGLVAGAERDLQRRPGNQVRGNKLAWRLVSLNALGAIAYLRWGRVR